MTCYGMVNAEQLIKLSEIKNCRKCKLIGCRGQTIKGNPTAAQTCTNYTPIKEGDS